MIEYYKRENVKGEIVGLGYIDSKNPSSMLFQMFEECEEYKQEEISVEEFIMLGGVMNFEGFKHQNYIIPSNAFEYHYN